MVTSFDFCFVFNLRNIFRDTDGHKKYKKNYIISF